MAQESRLLPPMLLEGIAGQGILFRGTNTVDFNRIKRENLGYYSISDQGKSYVTFTSVNPISAMIAGQHRCKKNGEYYPQQYGQAQPLLPAINISGYINDLRFGIEPGEIEICKPISFEDIRIISSFRRLHPFLSIKEKKSFAAYFNTYFKNNRAKDK